MTNTQRLREVASRADVALFIDAVIEHWGRGSAPTMIAVGR